MAFVLVKKNGKRVHKMWHNILLTRKEVDRFDNAPGCHTFVSPVTREWLKMGKSCKKRARALHFNGTKRRK